jgi:methyl-accepting chemotaxis protein
MARVSSDVHGNAEISHTTRQLLGDIVNAAGEVSRLIQHIADATREQKNTSHATAAAMERISQISESNSARVHGIDEAARGLGDIAYRLQSQMDRFRTG